MPLPGGLTSGSRPPWPFGCLPIATGRPWRPDTPYLGLPPSPAILSRLVRTAGLEAPWQELAAAGRLALTAAARLADWDPEARAAAWPFWIACG